jgi:hypothetical protein
MDTSEIDLRYVVDKDRLDTVVLHPLDDMMARRALRGDWVTERDLMRYRCWLASRRSKLPGSELEFEEWLATIADFDPVLTERDIEERLVMGEITEDIAELWRADLEKRQGSGRGESQAPPT